MQKDILLKTLGVYDEALERSPSSNDATETPPSALSTRSVLILSPRVRSRASRYSPNARNPA